MHTLAKAHGVRFSAHGLVPMGSFSRVYRLDEPKAMYELYGSGQATLGRLFGSGRFDRGLVPPLASHPHLRVRSARPHALAPPSRAPR